MFFLGHAACTFESLESKPVLTARLPSTNIERYLCYQPWKTKDSNTGDLHPCLFHLIPFFTIAESPNFKTQILKHALHSSPAGTASLRLRRLRRLRLGLGWRSRRWRRRRGRHSIEETPRNPDFMRFHEISVSKKCVALWGILELPFLSSCAGIYSGSGSGPAALEL